VVLLFCLSVALKVRLYPDRPLYVSDAAMRYRYAKTAASGEQIPIVDPKIQAPEGLRVRSLLFLFEDRTAGLSYRLLARFDRNISFDIYLKWFVCIFSSIAVVPAFLAASAIWRSQRAGLVAAALYAVSVPALERVIGNYLREEFALPFIFLSFFFFIASQTCAERKKASNLFGFFAGLLMFLALSSWHLSSFYLLLLLAGVVIVSLARWHLKAALRPVLYVVGFSVLAGILNEPLRTRLFLVSVPMMMGYCLVVVYALFIRFRPSRKVMAALLVLLLVLSLVPASLLSPKKGEYGHVYSLIFYKARYLLDKPADPGLLSSDARLLWIGPFQSPSLFSFLFGFGAIVIAALFPFIWILSKCLRSRCSEAEMMLLYMSAISFLMYLFVRRLEIFAIFFAALLVGGLARPMGRRWLALALVVVSVLLLFESYKSAAFFQSTPVKAALLRIKRPEVEKPSIHDRDRGEIFRWIRSSTPGGAVFLARFAASPMVVTYGERSAVLHPIFESKKMRERVLECAGAFYGAEKGLYDVCRKYGADYVLYEANQLLDDSELGERYLTDNLRLSTNSAAFLLHFAPERLRYFTPVFQTDYFRVFKVLVGAEEAAPVYLRYSPQYDPYLFKVDRMGSLFSDSLVALGWREIDRAFMLTREGGELAARGNLEGAVEKLNGALDIMPRLEGARFALAEYLKRAGRPDLSAEAYRKIIELDRFSAPAYLALASTYRDETLLLMAVEVLEEGVGQLPTNLELLEALALTYVELGDTAEAVQKYERVLDLDPDRADIRARLEELND
jgi:tetratricopeptide (TPR) repeat protein